MGLTTHTVSFRGKERDIKIQSFGMQEEKKKDYIVFGADTESSVRGSDPAAPYECQCVTLSTPYDGERIAWVDPERPAILELFKMFTRYLHSKLDPGSEVLVYFHNLEYDIGQLFKWHSPAMAFIRAGKFEIPGIKGRNNHGYTLGKVGPFTLILKSGALFLGNAPHFTIRMVTGTKGEHWDFHFRDTGSFFRGSLASIAKDLKLPTEKEKRQDDLGLRDYREVSENDPAKIEFTHYAKVDSQLTRLIGEKVLELHKLGGLERIRVSSPAFALQFLINKLGEDRRFITGPYGKAQMQLILDCYFGGRTGGIYHGAIDNISVLDFHSSYPASMWSLPSFTKTTKYISMNDIPVADFKRLLEIHPLCFARIDGEERDKKYPSLMGIYDKKLVPVYGSFVNLPACGPEILVGIRSGSLKINKIREALFVVETSSEISPFREFALEAYSQKAATELELGKASPLYIMWKLVLNSAYGKLIESRKPMLVGSTELRGVMVPLPIGEELEYSNNYLINYANAIEADNVEAYLGSIMDLVELFEHTGREYSLKPFEDLDVSDPVFGDRVIPAAAAFITSISRARLVAAIKCMGALYWDTDSMFVKDLDKLDLEAALAKGSSWLHKNFIPLKLGEELGALDIEIKNAGGWLAGTKRYYLTDGKKVKEATHGLAGLSKWSKDPAKSSDLSRQIIEHLANLQDSGYMAKARPNKAKKSLMQDIGRFYTAKIEAKAHLDDRLEWIQKGNYYLGGVQPWEILSR